MISPYIYPGTFRVVPKAETPPSPEPRYTEPKHIVNIVCRYYKVNPSFVYEKRRWSEVVKCRHIVWLLMRQYCHGISLKQCGRELGGFDHTTVMSALRKINDLIDTEPEIKAEVEQIRGIVGDYLRPINIP